jgi:hypothetical protein
VGSPALVLNTHINVFPLPSGCVGLRNVTLVISPQAVNRGQDVTLYCNYDLEKQPLYSVKWYRGKLEFYRFSPGESPATKIFYYPGINVDVSWCLYLTFFVYSFQLDPIFFCLYDMGDIASNQRTFKSSVPGDALMSRVRSARVSCFFGIWVRA